MIRRIGLNNFMKLASRAGQQQQPGGSGGKTVVVLGAGMGGLVATETLLKHLGPDDRVILVDRTPEQVIGLSLLWVMRGWQHPKAAVIERPAIYDDDRVEFIEAHVRSIAVAERTVTTANGHLHYDALVVALGAELDTSLVPGLPEALDQDSAGQFYTQAGAERLLSQLNSFNGKRMLSATLDEHGRGCRRR